MREIEFRVWHKLNKVMIYEGWNDYVFISKNEIFQFGETGEIMEYTGLKDRNNKKIYEGDIMEYGKIIWDDFNTGFHLVGKEYEHNMNYAKLNYIVTGNIYENA